MKIWDVLGISNKKIITPNPSPAPGGKESGEDGNNRRNTCTGKYFARVAASVARDVESRVRAEYAALRKAAAKVNGFLITAIMAWGPNTEAGQAAQEAANELDAALAALPKEAEGK